VSNACNVQYVMGTASERTQGAANGIELLTKPFHQSYKPRLLGNPFSPNHCILANMFQQHRKHTADRLIDFTVHDANVYGFLVLDDLLHT